MISSDFPCKQNRPRTEGLDSVLFIRPRGTAGLVKRALAFLCLAALLSGVAPAADPKLGSPSGF